MKDKWITIIVGLMSGILMALLVLYMMQMSVYALFSVSFWISFVIVCAIPHCFYVVKYENFNPAVCANIMILVSYGITLLYGIVISNASQYETIFMNIFVISTIFHISSLLSNLIRVIINRQKQKSEM